MQPLLNSEYSDQMLHRYKHAYLLARALNGLGSALRMAGFVFSIGSAIFTVINVLGNENVEAWRHGFIGVGVTILLFVGCNAIGDVVSAVAQMLQATLDTAVNTSPFLRNDQKAQVMSLQSNS